jgi:hypothetical protein
MQLKFYDYPGEHRHKTCYNFTDYAYIVSRKIRDLGVLQQSLDLRGGKEWAVGSIVL